MPEMILDPIQELCARCSLPHCCLPAKVPVANGYPKTRCSPLEASFHLLAHFLITARYLNCSLTPLITDHRGASGT